MVQDLGSVTDPWSNRLGWNYPKSNSPIGPGISNDPKLFGGSYSFKVFDGLGLIILPSLPSMTGASGLEVRKPAQG